MIKTFCDRCGIEESTRETIVHFSYRLDRNNEQVLRMDLCQSCTADFDAFARNFPVKHRNYTSNYMKVS
jgi:hypothetical protein